jgi:hypothetical protein
MGDHKMKETTAKIDGANLVITVPLQTPAPSKSGKTLTVASTHGFIRTEAKINDKEVSVSVNAFIRK